MRMRIAAFVIPTLVVMTGVGGRAHHAFSPVYEESRTITVEGVVTEFRFINPHALMSMDVTDAAAK